MSISFSGTMHHPVPAGVEEFGARFVNSSGQIFLLPVGDQLGRLSGHSKGRELGKNKRHPHSDYLLLFLHRQVGVGQVW